MRSKKVIALLISLTLLVSSVLPGTLAVSIDQDAASSSVTLTSGKQETPTPAPEEQQEQQDQNKQKDQNEQENTCTCGSTDGTHAEDCPLYEAPKTLMTASAQTAGNENYPVGHEWGKIRIRINVKLVDADGNETNAPAGVPVEVRRLLSGAYASKEGWTNQLVLFTGESDKNGVVYIDAAYQYKKDEHDINNSIAYLGSDSTDVNQIVYQYGAQHNNPALPGIRFDINPATDSNYTLNMVKGSTRNYVPESGSNAGNYHIDNGSRAYDDFVFHDGILGGNGQPDNPGGAYIEFDLYVKQKSQPTTATATIELNSYRWDHDAYKSSTYGSGQTDSPVSSLTYDIVYYDYEDAAATRQVLRTGGVTVNDNGKATITLSAEELQTLEAFRKTLPKNHHLTLDISPSTKPAGDGKTYAWDWQTVDGNGSAGVIGVRTMKIPDENGGWIQAKDGGSEPVTSGRYTYSPNPNHTPWLNQDLLTNGFKIQWNCYVTPSMTVTFDVGEGTGAFAAQQFKPITSVQGDQQNYLVSDPGTPTAPEGKNFVGWYKVESDGSLESTPWDFADRIVTKTMTLKAVYADKKYTVKFEVPGDDAETPASVQTNQYIIGNTPAWSGEDPEKDGYVFIGWKETEGSGDRNTLYTFRDTFSIYKTSREIYAENSHEAVKVTADFAENTVYTAQFEEALSDLTITKSGVQDIDENQSFLFDVTGPDGYSKRVVIKGSGSVTIKGLKIGEYTVKEVTDWSWRYTLDSETKLITLKATGENSVTFANIRSSTKWLDGNAYSKNEFNHK